MRYPFLGILHWFSVCKQFFVTSNICWLPVPFFVFFSPVGFDILMVLSNILTSYLYGSFHYWYLAHFVSRYFWQLELLPNSSLLEILRMILCIYCRKNISCSMISLIASVILFYAVILFLGACTKPPRLSMVTEYMEMGSLFYLIHVSGQKKKLSWRRRLKMLQDICR